MLIIKTIDSLLTLSYLLCLLAMKYVEHCCAMNHHGLKFDKAIIVVINRRERQKKERIVSFVAAIKH